MGDNSQYESSTIYRAAFFVNFCTFCEFFRKFLFTLVLVLGALTLTSCATYFYNTSNMNQSKTEVVLAEKNFKVG